MGKIWLFHSHLIPQFHLKLIHVINYILNICYKSSAQKNASNFPMLNFFLTIDFSSLAFEKINKIV